MASAQCCKPEDDHTMCNQVQQPHQSLSQKVSQAVSSVFKKDHTTTTTTSQCPVAAAATKNGQCPNSGGANNGTQCHGNGRRKNNGEARKKRGLIQKMTDGLSGHSDSSSSSESDSDHDDNNKCARNKN